MPVKYYGDEYGRYDDENYSYRIRPGSSGDFARRRRYGGYDEDDDNYVMSQVSLPLRLSQLDNNQRRDTSPFESYYSSRRSNRTQREVSPYSSRSRLSGPAKQALAFCGELDEDDPYYRARKCIPSPSEYEFEDDADEEQQMSWSDSRRFKQPPRYHPREDQREISTRHRSSTAPLSKHAGVKERHRSRKRDHEEDDFNPAYVMPVSRRRAEDISTDEEPAIREVTSYMAKRKQFAVEDDDELQKFKNQKYQYRTRGPFQRYSDLFDETDPREKYSRAPMFDMKLRSHVIWEKMYVKFTCTIRGNPDPKVTWYHNMVAIEPTMLIPGVMRISSQFGVHTLEIFQACLNDSGTYRVSAQNHKGEISSYATLLVRRYDGSKTGYYDIKSGYNLKKPTDYPDVEKCNVPGYPRFITTLFNKKVNEGDAVIMTCHVDGNPPPDVFWTLNGRSLDDKVNHLITDFDGSIASLTILKAYADDEGEYVCRVYNSCGASTSRCFISVRGENAPPSAPTELKCDDVTQNYVILSWKPPGYSGHFGGAPIIGYMIEKTEAGSSVWKPANQKAVKLTKTPIMSVEEGKVYFFRVRALNRWGRGPASMPVGPIAMRDPGTPRLPLELVDPDFLIPPQTDDICVEEEDPSDVPGAPCEASATLAPSGDSIFVEWVAPESENVEGYLIEYCDVETDEWITANSDPLQTVNPYPVTGLTLGKSYKFRVRAVNESGKSEPSDSTDIVIVGNENLQSKLNEDDVAQNVSQIASSDVNMTDDLMQMREDVKYRGPPTPPRDVQCMMAKREFIEIGWIPPAHSGGEQVRYFVEYRQLGLDEWMVANHIPIRYTRFPVGELSEGEMYMFRVRCVNTYGSSEFSEQSEPILASDGIKPPNWWGGVRGLFRVADDKGKPSVTKNSIKVCWEMQSTDGGSDVTGYYLEYRPCGGKFRPVNNKPLSQRHFTVDGLNPGEFYQFRIRACNLVGCGEWKVMPGKVQAKDPETPHPPTDLTVTGMFDESVSLSWKKPENIGDGEFIGYLVERRKEDADFWIPCNKIPEQVQDEKYEVDGLVQGQTYFFRVTAVNQVGVGATSLQSCYVTVGEPFDDVLDRQNAMREMERKKREEEQERLRLIEEEERKEAFTLRIEDCFTTLGSQGRFECRVKDRRTKVKWYLGNWKEITISPEGKYDVICSGNRRSLLINNCTSDDVQAVHCVAQYNECTSTADLVVSEMAPVHFVSLPTDVYIKSGERAEFSCVLTKPTAETTWTKYDEVIQDGSDARYELIKEDCERLLIIHDATYDDIAMYTIKGLGGSYTVNLIVDDVLPVKFNEKLSSADLPHTADVAVFQCLADPSPLFAGKIPPCKWYHGNELVDPDDDKYELISDGNLHVLKILNPTYEDNGEITCVVEGGKTTCSMMIEKPPPPPPKAVEKEDYIINFEQGLRAEALPGALRLFCVVTKLRDDAHIIWYHNDTEIAIEQDKYKIFNNAESGLVSLVISPITPDFSNSKFTCEFITPLSTFDTKVNYEFTEKEYENVKEKSEELQQDEEQERRERRQERERKKQERKQGKCTKEASVAAEKSETIDNCLNSSSIVVPQGLQCDVTDDGNIHVLAEANIDLNNCEVTWLKDSLPLREDRYLTTTDSNQTSLIIKSPCCDDEGTLTCQIYSTQTKCETSLDFTGKVFKQLLLKSAEIRIKPLSDCDIMAEQTETETESEGSVSEEKIFEEDIVENL